MKLQNISLYPVSVKINADRCTIDPGETKEVEDRFVAVLRDSRYWRDLLIVEDTPQYHQEEVEVPPLKKFYAPIRMPMGTPYVYDGYGNLMSLFMKYFEPSNRKKDPMVVMGHPRYEFPHDEKDKQIYFFTMFEADELPKTWVKILNKFQGVLVPSTWCKSVFEKSGVKVPIKIVPLATENFTVIRPPQGGVPFRFMHQNSLVRGDQKGWKIVIEAFQMAFGNDPGVELVLKGRTHHWANDTDDLPEQDNIKIITADLTRKELDELSEKTHCFVFPSRGEGFGLPPVEMMARGVPTIITDAHSMHDFAHLGIPIPVTGKKIEPHYEGRVEDVVGGHWVDPDVNAVAEAMKDVFVNYEKHKARAMYQRDKIIELYHTDVMFNNFIEAVEELSR